MISQKLEFNWANIQRVPSSAHGIYIFWRGDICVYVGKAERSSIRKRLSKHYVGTHNEYLKRWIESSITLVFQYEPVESKQSISAKERIRIKKYRPITNVLLVDIGER